jgi:hypothetical protein
VKTHLGRPISTVTSMRYQWDALSTTTDVSRSSYETVFAHDADLSVGPSRLAKVDKTGCRRFLSSLGKHLVKLVPSIQRLFASKLCQNDRLMETRPVSR